MSASVTRPSAGADPVAAPAPAGPSVLLVGPFPNRDDDAGGVGTFLTNLQHSPLGRGYRLRAFSTQRPSKGVPRRDTGYATLLRAGVGPALHSAAVTFWHVLAFPFVVLRSRARIVQVHSSSFWTFWESGCYVWLARLLGRRVILRYGGAAPEFFRQSGALKRLGLRLVFRGLHRMIVQSDSWAAFFSEWVRPERIIVLPNSLRPDDFGRRTRSRDDGRVVVLFMGGLEARRKGLEDVVAVIANVLRLAPQAEFHVVASPEDVWPGVPEDCRDRVKVEASIRGAEKYAAFVEADVFVLPSYGEGFPNTLLEAMAAGLAVIVTPVGAVPEVVQEPRNAFLIRPGDRQALERRLLELIGDARLRRRMGEANRTDVRARYDRDVVFDRLARVYEDLGAR